MDWSTAVPALIGAGGATAAGVVVARQQARKTKSNRRVDAYGEVLRWAHRLLWWVQQTRPTAVVEGDVPPDPPTMEDQINARTMMLLFGTKQATAAFDAFVNAANAFTHIASLMAMADAEHKDGHDPGVDMSQLFLDIRAARDTVTGRFDDLTKALRKGT